MDAARGDEGAATPDTVVLKPDKIPFVTRARLDRDLAVLIPDCDETRIAFSEVAEAALREGIASSEYRWKKFLSVSQEQETLECASSASSSFVSPSDSEAQEDAPQKPSRIWTGYYRVSLEQDMLPYSFSSLGWILGSSNSRLEGKGADLLLTLNPQKHGVRGRHALLAYDESTTGLWLRVGQRKRVRVNSDLIENSQRVCAELETGIEIGRLRYRLRFTDLDSGIIMRQLEHLKAAGKVSALPHKGFELTPTPNKIHYRDYVIHPPFAKGAFGLVHSCYKNDIAEPLVVKRILRDRKTREEIQNEVSILQIVGGHPNTCQLVEVFYSGSENFVSPADDAYIFLRPCADMNLDRFRTSGPTEENILQVSAQAVRGLEYMHSKGVMHRDIKPTNILVSVLPKLTVTVADYGHAIKATHSYDHMKGTLTYLAPEIWALKTNKLQARVPYNPKADVWSLACALLEFRVLKADKWRALDFRSIDFHMTTALSLKNTPFDNVIRAMWQQQPGRRPSMKDVAALKLWPHQEEDGKRSPTSSKRRVK